MPTAPFHDRLIAIREMLLSPSSDIKKEGLDLYFKLWLEHNENLEFKDELLQDATKNPDLIGEFKKLLRKLQLRNSSTNLYLGKHLDTLNVEAEKRRIRIAEETKPAVIPLPAKSETPEVKRFEWWQVLLAGIILTAIGLIIFLPDLYQKILVGLAAFVSAITLPYIFPQKDRTISVNKIGLKINYSFPTYLSIGDENTAHISIQNAGQADFNGKITLVFDDPGSFVTPAANQNLSVKVELSPNGRESKQFKFLVLKRPSDKNLKYHFEIATGTDQYKSNEESFLIAPIPYLRKTWAWMFGSAGVIIALLWKQVENLFDF